MIVPVTTDRMADAKASLARVEEYRQGQGSPGFAAESFNTIGAAELDELYSAQQKATIENDSHANRRRLSELFALRRDYRYAMTERRGMLKIGLQGLYRQAYELGANAPRDKEEST